MATLVDRVSTVTR